MEAKPFNNFSDEQLLQQLKESSTLAFNEIYNRYWARLYYAAFEMLKDKAAAGDSTQDIFISLWLRREQIEIQNLSSYLYGAVKRKALQHIRNGKVAQHHLDRITGIKFANETEEMLNETELKNSLTKGLSQLPEKCKEIFELSRFEDLSHHEIGERLNISTKTVANQINKAIKHLRTSFGDLISLLLFTIATI
jgi:RNA polymerase sigma-70 factor (family 1)